MIVISLPPNLGIKCLQKC